MAKADEHQFDRRGSDANVSALAFRVGILEGRVENVEKSLQLNNRELLANTALTKQVHAMAERTEKNIEGVVSAVQWVGGTRRLLIVIVAGVSGSSGAIIAAVHALKALGVLG